MIGTKQVICDVWREPSIKDVLTISAKVWIDAPLKGFEVYQCNHWITVSKMLDAKVESAISHSADYIAAMFQDIFGGHVTGWVETLKKEIVSRTTHVFLAVRRKALWNGAHPRDKAGRFIKRV